MPGANCSIHGCGSSRRTKGIGIFKLPFAKDEAHRKWREELLGQITKTRQIDQNFREQIKSDNVHICERHFKPEDIEIFIELIKFLLSEGMQFVLTERLCQDPVEEYFGKQRQLGRRSDNPDIHQFGYNGNTIRMQRSISCQSGNTRGRKDKKRAWEEVTDEKLPCRKKIKL